MRITKPYYAVFGHYPPSVHYAPMMASDQNLQMTPWFVYMVRCRDDSLYTGISSDPVRRERQHNGELVNGARYTRVRRPVTLVFVEAVESRSAAAKREHAIKGMSRNHKESLVRQNQAVSALRSSANNR